MVVAEVSAKKPRFKQLTVRGTPAQMGSQIGEECRDTIVELVGVVLERFNKGRSQPISQDRAFQAASITLPFVREYAPGPLQELQGVASAAGVPLEALLLLNARNMLSSASEGCTSVMVGDQASKSGVGFAGQNWDNDPAMDEFSLVLTRRPEGQPAITTWGQAGLAAYIGFNSEGIGVLMNALNGPSRADGVPWYFIVRALYETNSAETAVEAVKRARRAITANAAMITREGPADIEATPGSVELLRAQRNEALVHTNHCVHPSLTGNNEQYASSIYGQSFERKSRAETILSDNGAQFGIEDAKRILSDHEGHPTSICRHPNDDQATGWQRSVVSIILEPDAGRMHVSRGNPCSHPYEVYEAGR